MSRYHSAPPRGNEVRTMIRQRLKAFFLHLTCAVMLAVQWVPAHAHLDAVHQHDGPQHEHHATIHAHQPLAAHGDAFDLGHVEQDAKAIVDLDQSICAGVQVPDQAISAPALHRFSISAELFQRPWPSLVSLLSNRPPPHVGEPRAPPQRA